MHGPARTEFAPTRHCSCGTASHRFSASHAVQYAPSPLSRSRSLLRTTRHSARCLSPTPFPLWRRLERSLNSPATPFVLQGTLTNCWTKIFGQATLRALIAVFRPVGSFFRDAATVFLALGPALAEDGNSSLGCFEVRWCPWFSGWMRAASSSVRS
jgi:hypothetical protein